MAENLLEIKDLHAGVEGKEILKGLSLSVDKGEVHVILGPNGSGKSTLMNIIMGHPKYEVTSGTMSFEGEDITGLKTFERARKGLFLSFQTPEEIPGITVENMIRTSKQAISGERVKIVPFRRQLKETMEELKMKPEYAERYMNVGFSGGEKKRTALASIFTMNPAVWTLDEPETFLDAESQAWLTQFLQSFKDAGKTIIVTSHHPDIAGRIADRELRLTAEHQLG